MIYKAEDCEYTILIADLMVTLDSLDEFIIKLWIGSKDLPFKFDNTSDFHFLQEGIRVETDNRINYIFYDTIDSIQVIT